MNKNLPTLSDVFTKEEEPLSDFTIYLLTAAIIFFDFILYIVFLLTLVYFAAYQSSLEEGGRVYLMIFGAGVLASMHIAKDLFPTLKLIDIEDEEKFVSLLNVAIFKIDFELKRKLESEGIFQFKPSDWLNSKTKAANIEVQLVREGKAVVSGPKNDVERLTRYFALAGLSVHSRQFRFISLDSLNNSPNTPT